MFELNLKKIIFVFLFLFVYGVFCQTTSEDYIAENWNHEKNQFTPQNSFTNQNTSSTFMKGARLNGKVGVDILLFKIGIPLALEFEKPVIKLQNQKFMWLLQVRGGFAPIKETKQGKPRLCLKGECSKSQENYKKEGGYFFLPYGSAHTGLKYDYFKVLTTSITFGTFFTESLLGLTTFSIGWNVTDKTHIELHAGFPGWPYQFFKAPGPILVALSVGFPLKTW